MPKYFPYCANQRLLKAAWLLFFISLLVPTPQCLLPEYFRGEPQFGIGFIAFSISLAVPIGLAKALFYATMNKQFIFMFGWFIGNLAMLLSPVVAECIDSRTVWHRVYRWALLFPAIFSWSAMWPPPHGVHSLHIPAIFWSFSFVALAAAFLFPSSTKEEMRTAT